MNDPKHKPLTQKTFEQLQRSVLFIKAKALLLPCPFEAM